MLFAPEYPLEVRAAAPSEWYTAFMLKRCVAKGNFLFLDDTKRAEWIGRYCDEQAMRERWFGKGTPTRLFIAVRGSVAQGIGAVRIETVPRLTDFFVVTHNLGVGTAIFQARLSFLHEQGYPRARTELFAENQPVRHLYEKYGFEPTGEYRCAVSGALVYHYQGSTNIQHMLGATNVGS
jgi:GNAT superfamily N-acetyltransferase